MGELICPFCATQYAAPYDAGDQCVCGGAVVIKKALFDAMLPKDSVVMLKSEVTEMADLIMSMFTQGCLMPDGRYSHDCISAWEEAQEWLIEHGMIKPEQCKYQ